MIRIAFLQRGCNPFLLHYSSHSKAQLPASKSIAPSLQKHCFQPLKSMLLASKVNALGFQSQCSWLPKSMLSASKSYALGVMEHSSVCYGAQFCNVRSIALQVTEHSSLQLMGLFWGVWAATHLTCVNKTGVFWEKSWKQFRSSEKRRTFASCSRGTHSQKVFIRLVV